MTTPKALLLLVHRLAHLRRSAACWICRAVWAWLEDPAFVARMARGQRGQGLAEYALLLALIAVIAIVSLLFLGDQISRFLSTIGEGLNR